MGGKRIEERIETNATSEETLPLKRRGVRLEAAKSKEVKVLFKVLILPCKPALFRFVSFSFWPGMSIEMNIVLRLADI